VGALTSHNLKVPFAHLVKRPHVLPYPVEDLRKPKSLPVNGAVDERVPFGGFDLDVETIAAQEDVRRGEGDCACCRR
jgi:hypothetical protein